MFGFFQFDDTDPIGRAYRRYCHLLRVLCTVILVLAVIACFVGIPHLQCWTYTYTGEKPANGIPAARQKRDAWYWSITGWKYVKSRQYGQQGCPYILFIPVEDCIDLSKVKSIIPFSLVVKE